MADALMAIGLLLQVVVAVLNVRNARENRRDAERLAHGVPDRVTLCPNRKL